MASRSNKEQREVALGEGLLEQGRKSLSGRAQAIEDAMAEAEGIPAPKKKRKPSDEESE